MESAPGSRGHNRHPEHPSTWGTRSSTPRRLLCQGIHHEGRRLLTPTDRFGSSQSVATPDEAPDGHSEAPEGKPSTPGDSEGSQLGAKPDAGADTDRDVGSEAETGEVRDDYTQGRLSGPLWSSLLSDDQLLHAIENIPASFPAGGERGQYFDEIIAKERWRYFDEIIAKERVEVGDVCGALWDSSDRFNPHSSPDIRQQFASYFLRLLTAFRKKHPDSSIAISQNVQFAASLDVDDDGKGRVQYRHDIIHSAGQTGLAEIDRLLVAENRLSRQAKEFVAGEELHTSLEMLMDACVALIGLMDSLEYRGSRNYASPSAEAIALIDQLLADAEAYAKRAAQRQAQAKYFRGMLTGGAAIYALALATLTILGLTPAHEDRAYSLAAWCAIAGCTGAIVSVLTRFTRGTLVLDYTMKSMVFRVGVFRPIIGAVFALAVYALVASGLISMIDVPQDPVTAVYFFIAVAFVAGFSERFAQDVLSATEGQLSDITGTAGRPTERQSGSS
jgi:hypothetical protein